MGLAGGAKGRWAERGESEGQRERILVNTNGASRYNPGQTGIVIKTL